MRLVARICGVDVVNVVIAQHLEAYQLLMVAGVCVCVCDLARIGSHKYIYIYKSKIRK